MSSLKSRYVSGNKETIEKQPVSTLFAKVLMTLTLTPRSNTLTPRSNTLLSRKSDSNLLSSTETLPYLSSKQRQDDGISLHSDEIGDDAACTSLIKQSILSNTSQKSLSEPIISSSSQKSLGLKNKFSLNLECVTDDSHDLFDQNSLLNPNEFHSKNDIMESKSTSFKNEKKPAILPRLSSSTHQRSLSYSVAAAIDEIKRYCYVSRYFVMLLL
jgi:hypothetical protein